MIDNQAFIADVKKLVDSVTGAAQLPWHLPVQHWTDEEKAKLLAAPQASEKQKENNG